VKKSKKHVLSEKEILVMAKKEELKLTAKQDHLEMKEEMEQNKLQQKN